MQSILCNDPVIGSIDWELPKELSEALSLLPADQQETIRKILREQMSTYAMMLVGIFYAGDGTAIKCHLDRFVRLQMAVAHSMSMFSR